MYLRPSDFRAGGAGHPGRVLIAGDGLVLRPWSDHDLESMCLLFDDPDVARWTPLESPFDAAAARRYLVRAADRARTGEALHLAVTTQGTDPLGEVLLFDRGGGTGELGYVIGAAYRGRRLASRAVRLLGDHAVRVRGMHRLVLRIEAGNAASERVALACGYRPADAPAPPMIGG
jgi:RimJ/RimL family protein N-acetyltransferase